MKNLRVVSALLAAGLIAGSLGAGIADAKPKKKKKSGPIVVGTDPADDWGSNVDPTLAPFGDALGQEVIEAAIEQKDKKTINFHMKVASLPPSGGVPEFTRYVWTMMVDDELLQLDGKFTNYSRGACDPTAGTCPPPRDPGQGAFSIRGNCTDNGGAAVTCEEIGSVTATFDTATATIVVPVPLKVLGAKPGSRIINGLQPGSNFQGVSAMPSAFFSQGNLPFDELIVTKAYVVPK